MKTDREILELRALGKKEEALRAIVESYSERLYFLIRRFGLPHDDADDILQDIYIKVWSSLDSFRGDSGLYTWLYRIANNEVLSNLRKARVKAFLGGERLENRLNNVIDEDPGFNGTKLQRELQKAINTLPPKQKQVFIFRYFDELPYEDISRITGTSVGSLKASYHHAYTKIREILENNF